jgi:hypothetical protein
MTILQAIERIDGLLHNTYTQEQKIQWLSQVDTSVKHEVIDTHENPPKVIYEGYDQNTSLDTILLIPEPYDDLYVRWLESQIHYYNGEYDKYNQAISMYNAAMSDFVNYYNRTQMPKGRHFSYF